MERRTTTPTSASRSTDQQDHESVRGRPDRAAAHAPGSAAVAGDTRRITTFSGMTIPLPCAQVMTRDGADRVATSRRSSPCCSASVASCPRNASDRKLEPDLQGRQRHDAHDHPRHDERGEDPERGGGPAARPPMRPGGRPGGRGGPRARRGCARGPRTGGRGGEGRLAHAAAPVRSAARSFALRARGFRSRSSASGTSGFFVRTVRRSSSRKARLTVPSSSE